MSVRWFIGLIRTKKNQIKSKKNRAKERPNDVSTYKLIRMAQYGLLSNVNTQRVSSICPC